MGSREEEHVFICDFLPKRLKNPKNLDLASFGIWGHVAFCACTAYKSLKAIDSSRSLDNPEPQAGLAAGQISPRPKRDYSWPLPPHSQNTNTLTDAFLSRLTCCLPLESVSTLSQETTGRTTSQTSQPQVWEDSCLRQQKPQSCLNTILDENFCLPRC